MLASRAALERGQTGLHLQAGHGDGLIPQFLRLVAIRLGDIRPHQPRAQHRYFEERVPLLEGKEQALRKELLLHASSSHRARSRYRRRARQWMR